MIERLEQAGRSYFVLNWDLQTQCTEESVAQPMKVQTYVTETLIHGACSHYLTTRFMQTQEGRFAYYDVTGFLSLSEYRQQQKKESGSWLGHTVSLLRKLAEGEELAEDFLMMGDHVQMKADYIFVSPQNGRVALAYVPSREKTVFSARLCHLLNELVCFEPKGEIDWLVDKLEEEIITHAPGTNALLRMFSRWERELN